MTAHIVAGHGFHAVEVVGVGVAEALGKGEEIVVEHVLPSGGQGGDGAAVEGVVEGDDGPPSFAVLVKGVLAGQLDQALVALAPELAKNTLDMPAFRHSLWAAFT